MDYIIGNDMRNTINCNTRYIGKQYVWLEETDSTNNVIKRLLVDGATLEAQADHGTLIEGDPGDGVVIVANHQTAGRGRSGHEWESEAGTSLSFSMLLKPKINNDSIAMVTLVSAMAVAKTIKDCEDVDTQIKWPNDVIVDGKKICGILTELDVTNGESSLIVGIGINVNQTSFPVELEDKATSIRMVVDHLADVENLMNRFCEVFEGYYDRFIASGNLASLKEEYNGMLVNVDREVKVLDPSENITGIARGIDDTGRLLVETEDGVMHSIYAGEVSVRGLYGYV